MSSVKQRIARRLVKLGANTLDAVVYADGMLYELGWDDAPEMTFDFTVPHDEVIFDVPYKLIRVDDD